LTIGVPSRFFLDWIRSNFRREIETACVEVLGQCPAIDFRVDAPATDVPPGASDLPGASASPATVAPEAESAPAPSRMARRKFASLASFVTGSSNRLAVVSAEMVARSPGQISPLVIHGPTGVGKTHLLEGIWSAVRKTSGGPGRSLLGGPAVVYLSAEQFTSQFLEALRGSGLPNFRRKYRGVDVLLLDDLQFLVGKRATQVELLHTIDTLLGERQQLVLAADRPPAELTELAPELLARLTSGMVCRIEPPDYTTRLGIVGQLALRNGIELPADVQRFVASRLTTHARELSGAICRLQATSEAMRRKITLALAEDALGEMIHHNQRVVRLGDIQKAVCKVFGLEPATLQSEGKSKRVSHPRMLAMWLARKHTRAALSEIGEFFGRRSHSTVISAEKRVNEWMAAGEPLHLAEQTWGIDEAIRQVERSLLAG
jgi:chromosomal replication initiator protein